MLDLLRDMITRHIGDAERSARTANRGLKRRASERSLEREEERHMHGPIAPPTSMGN